MRFDAARHRVCDAGLWQAIEVNHQYMAGAWVVRVRLRLLVWRTVLSQSTLASMTKQEPVMKRQAAKHIANEAFNKPITVIFTTY
jgi:hypothetical protein